VTHPPSRASDTRATDARLADAIDRLAVVPPILVVTDFDGTLAPIVSEPPDAKILPEARRALRRLAALGAHANPRVMVAVLSGRDAADVARRVGVAGLRYLGQHGIEEARLPDPTGSDEAAVTIDSGLAARGRELEAMAARAAAMIGHPDWLVIEPKGASVGLHYRRASDPEQARSVLLAALGRLDREPDGAGILLMESRRVVELRPADAHGKGVATSRLIDDTGPRSVLILGDDRTDAEAFEVVRRWRSTSGWPAMVVGVSGSGETPVEVRELSDVLVADPAAAAAVLDRLADLLEGPEATGP